MASTAIARQGNPGEAGFALTLTAVDGANGNNVDNSDGKTILVVRNASGASINVTVAVQVANPPASPQYGFITKSNIVLAVAAGAQAVLGPLPAAVYNDSTGKLQITFSAAASVTLGAFAQP